MTDLRDYQQRAVLQLEDALAAGKNPIWVAPTGSGKSLVIATLVERAVERGQKCLILTHRKELLAQLSHKMPVDHGLIISGLNTDLDQAVQIASVQTLHARAIRSDRLTLPSAHLIIADEAHRVLGQTWRSIIAQYPNARVAGFTATPCRGDGRGLGGVFDELIIGPQVAELVAQGHLVPAVYYAPCDIDLKGVKTQAGDYQIKQLAERVDRPELVGDIVSSWHRHGERRKTIAFCVDVAHSLNVAEEFRRSGARAECVHGETPKTERDAILARLVSGETEIVVNAMLLTEGYDCPDVGCIILARPTKNMGLYRQAAGRGLRPAPGKSDVRIIDHAGACFRHGLLSDPIVWQLSPDKRAENPTHAHRNKSAFSKLLECTQCHALRKGGEACEHCGWQPKRRAEALLFAEGELALVSGGKPAKAPVFSQADQQRFYQQLIALRLEHNAQRASAGKVPLKQAWSAAKYKEKFDAWPPFAWNSLPPAAAVSPEVRSWVRSRDIVFAKRASKKHAA
jgi:DNA repair protein RadD